MSKKKSDTTLPIWIWLLAGLALAGLVMFLILLSRLQPPQYNSVEEASAPNAPEQLNKNHLDFYDRLKNAVVPIDETNSYSKPLKKPDNSVHLLQVASFRDISDAKQVQAELILLGLKSNIEKSKNDNGDTWYRIISGPFQNRSKQQRALSLLQSNNYSPIRLKRKVDKND